MSQQDQDRLQNHVDSIAKTLTEGFAEDDLNHDGEQMSAYDYLEDALDIEYIVNSKAEYLGARILVAFGGPNIWVDTRKGIIEGYWWGDYAKASFDDAMCINEALEELWNCR